MDIERDQHKLGGEQCRRAGEEQQLKQEQGPVSHPGIQPVEREGHQHPGEQSDARALTYGELTE